MAKQTGNLIIDGFAMQPEHSTFSLPLLHHSRLVFMFRSAIDKIKPKKRDFFCWADFLSIFFMLTGRASISSRKTPTSAIRKKINSRIMAGDTLARSSRRFICFDNYWVFLFSNAWHIVERREVSLIKKDVGRIVVWRDDNTQTQKTSAQATQRLVGSS